MYSSELDIDLRNTNAVHSDHLKLVQVLASREVLSNCD